MSAGAFSELVDDDLLMGCEYGNSMHADMVVVIMYNWEAVNI